VTPKAAEEESKKQEDSRTYVLNAETAEEANQWLDAMEDSGAIVMRSIKEGYMFKVQHTMTLNIYT
jgi:hypothetical protein